MDKEQKKAKKLVIGLLLGCLCIALACFGFGVYVLLAKRGGEYVSDNMIMFSKPIFMVGIFFLVLAFGYLLPVLLSHNKHKQSESGASGIFSEINMRKALEKYIPDGETLLAGIHAVAKETSVTAVFGKCIRTENGLVPHEDGGTIALNKRKYATYDIYFGITQHSFLITECEKSSYYYEFEDGPGSGMPHHTEYREKIIARLNGSRA